MTKSRNSIKYWILMGIPVIFIFSYPMHFIFEWSGKLNIVGIFAPVNESIWEHLKLSFWPMLIWWVVGYFILSKKREISAARWFTSCSVALLVCPLVILTFVYTYTGAWGIELLLLDIFSLLLSLIVSHSLALHFYNYAKTKSYSLNISILIIILLIIVFTAFTFCTPQIPLFKDSLTGKYGI